MSTFPEAVLAHFRNPRHSGELESATHRAEVTNPVCGDVLQFAGTLNHIAANLNQIAKKRNSFDELSVLERARLNQQSTSLQQLVTDIKGYLQ